MAITPKSPVDIPNTTGTITPITPPTTSLANARIGYKNLLTVAPTPVDGKMLTANTYERYPIQSGSSSILFELVTPSEISFIGFAGHNLSYKEGVTVEVKYSTSVGGALTSIYTSTFSSDDALMVLLDGMTGIVVTEIQIIFNISAFGAKIGVFSVGQVLEMQRSIYGGHSPADLSLKTSYQSTESESGNFLGRTVTRRGTATTFSWKHLSPDWYRDNFQPFVKSAVEKPFFITWKPSLYPLVTSYGFTEGDIKPSNMGGGSDLMAVSFNFKGHSD